jgi:hypothetical protein
MGSFLFPTPTHQIPIPATAAAFRVAAPAFKDVDMFPDDSVSFWLQAAAQLLNPNRWRSSIGLGTLLFVQHNLALEAFATEQAEAGGIPGMARGVVSAEAGKSVSASYDTALAGEPDAGHWNLTVYGSRFIRMTRMFGMGPIQVNTGPVGGGFFNFGNWSGAPFGPGWWTH